jgi:Tfp pilus assembly protein PilE
MGQQQLLLVILVTIIVGIATVVAINVFGSSAANANRDAVRQDMLAAIANAEGYFLKPNLMGGGGGTYTGMTIQDLGIPGRLGDETANESETNIYNENGSYDLEAPTADRFVLVGTPQSGGDELRVVVTRVNNRPSTFWGADETPPSGD